MREKLPVLRSNLKRIVGGSTPGAPPLSRPASWARQGADFEFPDLAGASNTLGAPSFAHSAKGGSRECLRNVVRHAATAGNEISVRTPTPRFLPIDRLSSKPV